jgi:hypothetical protein
MAALARYTYYTAFSALLSAVSGYAMGEMPIATPTRGCGFPLADLLPTDAPSLELVKKQFAKRLVKKSVTNICTEWTLEGGGQPECNNSETCLFTTGTDSALYEGCGQTSISYNWITECFPYSQTQTGTAPVSQIYCAEEAPACGYYAFRHHEKQPVIGSHLNFNCRILDSKNIYMSVVSEPHKIKNSSS